MSRESGVWRRFFLGFRRKGEGPLVSSGDADWRFAQEYARAVRWRRYLRGYGPYVEPDTDTIRKAYGFLFGGGVISREPVWW